MGATAHLFGVLLASVLLSLAVLRVLSCTLASLLARLCPDKSATAFWLRYVQLMRTLAPLVVALWIGRVAGDNDPPEAFRLPLMASLVGLLISQYVVGHRLGRFVVDPGQDVKA